LAGFSLNSEDRIGYRRLALATVSGLALCFGGSAPAWAQQAEPGTTSQADEPAEDETEIVVTGLRASLESAQNIKQNADTFVDVITAQDIGALADRSVAEALQRVPGVNISRFEQRNDPDRFSVEGSGVIIRGLPFVRSELNGRDIFSANGGRELSFNDVSPELLGRVEVFKNVTADMIEGALSGTVNLVTRKPVDKPGLHLAGTIEANYGDMAKEWSPGFSVLGSGAFETGMGTFGIQLAYAQSELVTKTDASQITDPCYRQPSLDGPCLRLRPVGSGGIGGGFNFDPDDFPPAGAVIAPKGAGVRTTDLTRDRNAYSGVLQWESLDGKALVTLEYLRAETEATLNEYSALALVNDDGLFPIQAPGTQWTFDSNGIFQTGTLTQLQPFTGGRGIPTEMLRFQRQDEAKTEDYSIDIDLAPTDRLRFNVEVQHITSDRTEEGLIAAMQTYSDVFIDNSGRTPIVQFLEPATSNSPSSYFNDPSRSLYWFLLDNQVRNDGELTTMRADIEYDVSDTGFLKQVRFGARWGDRNRVTRNANFANWGNLGAPWTGRNGNWNCDDFQAFGCGGAYVTDFPDYAQVRNPFGDGFQRGNVPVPFGNGSAFFFGGDDMVGEYLSGATQDQATIINDFTQTPNRWNAIANRPNALPGLPWTAAEISDVDEQTDAFYARADFGSTFGNGWEFEGNLGLRYVKTKVRSQGEIGFPVGNFFDDTGVGGNGDGVVQVSEVQNACSRVVPGQIAPGYCSLSPARQAEFAATFTGELIDDDLNISYDEWLPSLNLKLDVGGGLLFRAAVSKGIARPDLNAYASGGGIFDNTNNLRAAGTLESGPLFAIGTGNRFLLPTQAWNYDLSAEWYFDAVGSVTVSAFYKDITAIVNSGQVIRTIDAPSGISRDVAFNTPVNIDEGKLKGVEIAYQQTYDFLPGPLSGLGAQLVYTYVDSEALGNSQLGAEQSPFAENLELVGVSKHTVNAVVFYEKGPLSARAAYNWRSDFLQTPRDVIFPFSPIYGEATGQLDGSIFFSITDQIKLGIQGVNLLDEVTRTSQVIDFDGTRITRSAFRNDRRYTFVARFDF
jgi:TonB-dependent receptor